jgi:hypothetical protein
VQLSWDLFLYREIRRPGLWVLWTGGERVHRGLTMGGWQELTVVRVGRRGGGVIPAMERIGDGGRSSTGAAFRARRGGDDDGNELWMWWPGCCALL